MAIYIRRKYKSDELRKEEQLKFHEALVGSPAYKGVEIAIVNEGEKEFTLCIGNNNDNDIHMTYIIYGQGIERLE